MRARPRTPLVQGVRVCAKEVRARPPTQQVQGVRRIVDMRARPPTQRLQGVPPYVQVAIANMPLDCGWHSARFISQRAIYRARGGSQMPPAPPSGALRHSFVASLRGVLHLHSEPRAHATEGHRDPPLARTWDGELGGGSGHSQKHGRRMDGAEDGVNEWVVTRLGCCNGWPVSIQMSTSA